MTVFFGFTSYCCEPKCPVGDIKIFQQVFCTNWGAGQCLFFCSLGRYSRVNKNQSEPPVLRVWRPPVVFHQLDCTGDFILSRKKITLRSRRIPLRLHRMWSLSEFTRRRDTNREARVGLSRKLFAQSHKLSLAQRDAVAWADTYGGSISQISRSVYRRRRDHAAKHVDRHLSPITAEHGVDCRVIEWTIGLDFSRAVMKRVKKNLHRCFINKYNLGGYRCYSDFYR